MKQNRPYLPRYRGIHRIGRIVNRARSTAILAVIPPEAENFDLRSNTTRLSSSKSAWKAVLHWRPIRSCTIDTGLILVTIDSTGDGSATPPIRALHPPVAPAVHPDSPAGAGGPRAAVWLRRGRAPHCRA